jgi:hypothetical protein
MRFTWRMVDVYGSSSRAFEGKEVNMQQRNLCADRKMATRIKAVPSELKCRSYQVIAG